MTRVRYRWTTVYVVFGPGGRYLLLGDGPTIHGWHRRQAGFLASATCNNLLLPRNIIHWHLPRRGTPHSVSSKFSGYPLKHFRHTRILRAHNRFRVKSHQKICDTTEIASTYIASANLILSLPIRALLSPSSPVAVHPTVVTATLSLGLIRDSARRPLRAHE